MSAATVEVSLAGGDLLLSWPHVARTGPIRARALDSEGAEHRSEGWTMAGGRYVCDCGPLRISLSIDTGGSASGSSGGLAELHLEAEAGAAADLVEVGLVMAPSLEGTGEEIAWIVYSGYQSWDASGIVPAAAEPRRSWWTLGLATSAGGGLALAARSAERSTTRYDWTGDSLQVTAAEPDGLTPRPQLWAAAAGDRWSADPWVVGAGADVQAELARVAATAGGRLGLPVPQGWLSWYHYGPWITAAEVLENSRELDDGCLGGLGYSVVQVDDGWQRSYGDWIPNERFPGGLTAIAEVLARRGQQLGVWTAPFLVSTASGLAAAAPDDWFVGDPLGGGRAVDPVHMVFGPMNVLDARNPAVQDHLESTFRDLRRQGVRYFKIDFLYAGGYAGTAAVRAGVQAIRRGIGDDSYLLACGAPLLPMVGICDGCRIGRDTATPVFDFELGAPKPTLLEDEVADVARNQAARHHLASWFHLDADVALVGGNLTLGQAQCSVAYCVLSGGPFFASDALPALGPDRLSLLRSRAVLDLIGGPTAVPDWAPTDRDRAATVWRQPDAIGVFNWDDTPRVVKVRIPHAGTISDLWTGESLGHASAEVDVPVDALGARLLRYQRD